MLGERVDMRSCVCVPETNGGVRSPACNSRAIGTKRYAYDPIPNPVERLCMPSERAELAARVDIPETDSSVLTPAYEGCAIGTKGYAVDSRRMPGECAEM